jgi:hypothetical protein
VTYHGYVCFMRYGLTSLRETISPLAFLIFLRRERKYQTRLLATTVLGAKMRIR